MTVRPRFLLMLGWALAIFYVSICVVLYANQEELLFHPRVGPVPEPRVSESTVTTLHLRSADGTELVGWSAAPVGTTPDRWVLYCHGNGGNRSDRFDRIQMLNRLGYGAVIFDYRGYGDSAGQIHRQSDLFADADAFYAYLASRTDKIVILGESLGGGVAAYLAQTHPCRGLILESTFTSLKERAWESYPALPIPLICSYPMEVRHRVEKLTMPKLFMHSPTDEMIEFHHGRDLFAAAAQPKQWVELTGGHNNPDRALLYKSFHDFLGSLAW